ncbi:MAG: hypothetical protein L0K30_00455 [Acidipropionibacterium jensenii]|uniref:hypothetical protein n=1 Tax=Acidipropionibacterium jensenii TaxID=1749 RepID=UPI00264882CC|nr:hypothetical protein [Acidipropionibacterium jensenii]MDN6440503.1 hypothetical protein [Acidipropionibacterium jensenii]
MTDITDLARRAREWAEHRVAGEGSPDWSAAEYILATVDAPYPTLAEELRDVADNYNYGMSSMAAERVDDIADRVEHELAEARAEVEHLRDLTVALSHERDEVRDEVERVRAVVDPEGAGLPPGMTVSEAVQTLVDGIPTGEHEGLTAEQWKREYDRTHAEVERLTAVDRRRTDNYREFREQFLGVQKDAESNAETPDPADVPAGEAWIVECDGEKRTAVKDRGDAEPWNTVNADGWMLTEDDEDITLVAHLVPAPRVITNPHDLDRLPHNSVILSADNDAWQKSSETSLWASAWWATINGEPSIWSSRRLCDEDHPATVLWEPEA